MHLVIGGRGLIGTAVCQDICERKLSFDYTTRVDFDLRRLDFCNAPSIDVGSVVYLVAAIPGFKACKHNPDSWIVNRDAPIAIARHYKSRAFIVFISSDVVDKQYDWEYSAYPRQKAEVEAYINSIDGAIIRPTKVPPERASELAKVIVDVGLSRRPGVTRWS